MVHHDGDDSVAKEVQSRLDELFGALEDDTPGSGESVPKDSEDPLLKLKSLLLSIEWEITDEVMTDLIVQVDNLKQKYQKEKILLLFLQLLGSIANYIKSHKGRANPKAFPILNSVFACIEKTARETGISDLEKKKILCVELKKFKELKEEIAQNRRSNKKVSEANPIRAEVSPGQLGEPDVLANQQKTATGMETPPFIEPEPEPAVELESTLNEAAQPIHNEPAKEEDRILQSLEEIKHLIVSEFKSLRAELALLRKDH